MARSVILDEVDYDPGFSDGSFSRLVTTEAGRHLGELVWSPVDQPRARSDIAYAAGWNVVGAYMDWSGRMLRDTRPSRILGLRSERAALRALLAQVDWNQRTNDRERA